MNKLLCLLLLIAPVFVQAKIVEYKGDLKYKYGDLDEIEHENKCTVNLEYNKDGSLKEASITGILEADGYAYDVRERMLSDRVITISYPLVHPRVDSEDFKEFVVESKIQRSNRTIYKRELGFWKTFTANMWAITWGALYSEFEGRLMLRNDRKGKLSKVEITLGMPTDYSIEKHGYCINLEKQK